MRMSKVMVMLTMFKFSINGNMLFISISVSDSVSEYEFMTSTGTPLFVTKFSEFRWPTFFRHHFFSFCPIYAKLVVPFES
jgi:hypothetical protein